MKQKLFYGMKLKDQSGEVLTVEKYWPEDKDANSYKVKLGHGSFYSMDLISLINSGFFEEVLDNE